LNLRFVTEETQTKEKEQPVVKVSSLLEKHSNTFDYSDNKQPLLLPVNKVDPESFKEKSFVSQRRSGKSTRRLGSEMES